MTTRFQNWTEREREGVNRRLGEISGNEIQRIPDRNEEDRGRNPRNLAFTDLGMKDFPVAREMRKRKIQTRALEREREGEKKKDRERK